MPALSACRTEECRMRGYPLPHSLNPKKSETNWNLASQAFMKFCLAKKGYNIAYLTIFSLDFCVAIFRHVSTWPSVLSPEPCEC